MPRATALTPDQARRAEWALAAAEAKLRRPALQDAGELLELVRRGLPESLARARLEDGRVAGARSAPGRSRPAGWDWRNTAGTSISRLGCFRKQTRSPPPSAA